MQHNYTGTTEPIQAVLLKLPDAKKSGTGYVARCPAHDDGVASLSIGRGDDGRVLLKCFAGCHTDEIVSALGMTKADLFAPKRDNGRPRSKVNSPRIFPTADEAVTALELQHGKRSALWVYRNSHGQPVGVIVRWDKPEGKDIRPVSLNGMGWAVKAMVKPRPLYRLSELAKADRVFIVEGEKCADCLVSMGLSATTSAGGSMSAAATDWTVLAGKAVVILPDNDAPGRKYGADVVALLAALNPAATVKIVELPGLGDVADLYAACVDDDDRAALRMQIETLADEAEPVKVERPGADLVRLSDVKPEPIGWLWPGRARRCGSATH